MTKTEIALHLTRCGTLTADRPEAAALIADGLASIKRGRLTLTPAGHAVMRKG